ncbi:hypothetical protein [uncultured Draconibacterium sp.]|uniref:hypothetical protein n=1 Tax=uncultured Draconibacterium sp. TaxID=1573823 RepID=UPI003261CFBA
MTPCKNAEAVQELLNWTCAEHYTDVIDELWEAWICGELSNGTNATDRSERFSAIKELKRFLKTIKES